MQSAEPAPPPPMMPAAGAGCRPPPLTQAAQHARSRAAEPCPGRQPRQPCACDRPAPPGKPHAMAVYKPPAPGRPIHVPRGLACPQNAYPCGCQACQQGKASEDARPPALGNFRFPAARPSLRECSTVAARSEAQGGTGKLDAKWAWHGGIVDGADRANKT